MNCDKPGKPPRVYRYIPPVKTPERAARGTPLRSDQSPILQPSLPHRPQLTDECRITGCGRTRWCRQLCRRYRQLMSRLSRITSDPSVCHGQPTVRGMRYPVENLLELLSSGMTIDDVLQDYPDLERDDLLAALEFGALTAGSGRVVPLGAA